MDAFLEDTSTKAYEKLIDRLLRSPRYGQRMAIDWLDAARYGDTSVYHADGPRDMWAWRDAIVDAFNLNMPFDEFSINQLAGDLIPNANDQQQLLAGFNRNNGTTDEGGAIAEEYRVEYVVDRVKTTSTVWLGLTMECGQCHDHKYDPISQEDYYRFYAFSIPAVMEACKHGEAMQHRYFKLRTLLKKSNYRETTSTYRDEAGDREDRKRQC